MEGESYILFDEKIISSVEAEANYKYWKNKNNIPSEFDSVYNAVFGQVSKVHGAHTFAFRTNSPAGVVFPLLKIFSFDDSTQVFRNRDCGVLCDRIRKGDGAHMGTARQLGLDKFVFSYVGMHLPYHRTDDPPPIFPFGLYVKPSAFARMHGSPCDRDFIKNDEVDRNNIDKYFLLPEDLQRLITDRIINDPLFAGDFWTYYGNPTAWDNEDYRRTQWKKKGEYCHYEKLDPTDIGAILWPVWEEDQHNDGFSPNQLYDLIPSFKTTFGIQVILYRPYGGIISKDTWNRSNMRDWEISLIEASYLAHRFFHERGQFPDSILVAREYFKSNPE